ADVIAFFVKVMDGSVPAVPRFTPGNSADLQFAFDPARGLVPTADPDAIALWLHQLSYVRPAVARLDAALAAGRLIQTQAYAPAQALGQLPRTAGPDLLLALAPESNRQFWDAAVLRDIVSETFDWAALRTVDLDSLGDFGQILPALYYGLNTGGVAAPDTVSTDFGASGMAGL